MDEEDKKHLELGKLVAYKMREFKIEIREIPEEDREEMLWYSKSFSQPYTPWMDELIASLKKL